MITDPAKNQSYQYCPDTDSLVPWYGFDSSAQTIPLFAITSHQVLPISKMQQLAIEIKSVLIRVDVLLILAMLLTLLTWAHVVNGLDSDFLIVILSVMTTLLTVKSGLNIAWSGGWKSQNALIVFKDTMGNDCKKLLNFSGEHYWLDLSSGAHFHKQVNHRKPFGLLVFAYLLFVESIVSCVLVGGVQFLSVSLTLDQIIISKICVAFIALVITIAVKALINQDIAKSLSRSLW